MFDGAARAVRCAAAIRTALLSTDEGKASFASSLITSGDDAAELQAVRALLSLADRWTYARALHPEASKKVKGWATQHLPHNLDFEKLVELETPVPERPEMFEHFGMATAEAMSAGCVPIVINKGGQPEIVQHGENGFVWDKPEELREYTELLMRDERLRARMAEAARARAALFSREQFINRFLNSMGFSEPNSHYHKSLAGTLSINDSGSPETEEPMPTKNEVFTGSHPAE